MNDAEFPERASDEALDLEELARLLEEEPASGPPPPPRKGTTAAGGALHDRNPGTWAVGLATLLVLLAGVWATSAERTLPDPVPANAQDSVFSSGRAMARLVDLAREPRPVGSPEHTRVRELILERLEDLELEPDIQTSLSLRRSGGAARAVTLRNVLARIPGTASTGTIVLTAHYDAVPLSSGAGDDGTGVVAILETVRALRAGAPLRNDVVVLITDAEELGLLGARAFVEEHPWMEDVSVVLSVEMRGGGGPVQMFETGADNGWIVGAMQASDPRPLAGSFSVEIYRRLPNDTDFTPFREAGIQGLNFAAIDRAWIYHQPTDVAQNVQEETLQHHGMRVLAITKELGSRDLTSVDAPDRVYATLPVIGIVSYPLGWAVPISAAILLAWLGVTPLAAAAGGRWLGVLAGSGLALVAGGSAWLLGRVLMAWLPRFHPEYQTMTPAFYGEGWYVLGLAAGVLALTLTLLGLARRRFSTAALASGALVLPAVGAVVLAIVAPLTSMILQGPVLAGVLAVGVMAAGGGARREGRTVRWARVVIVMLALPVLAFMVPLFEGLWIAMSFRLASLLGVLLVVGFSCLLPTLDGLGEPNRWWAPLVAVIAAALLVGGGILQAGPSADRPLGSTLLYALDRQTDEAVWATREDAGFRWAENMVGPFTDERALNRFLVGAPFRTVSAPIYPIPAPTVRFEGRSPETLPGGFRFEVNADAGAERVSVLLPEGEEGGLIAVNGVPVPQGEPGSPGARRLVTRVTHHGVPDGALMVDVGAPDGAAEMNLIIVEEHLRPREYLGEEPFQRPAHLMPSPQGRSDRILVRTPVRVPLSPGADPAGGAFR